MSPPVRAAILAALSIIACWGLGVAWLGFYWRRADRAHARWLRAQAERSRQRPPGGDCWLWLGLAVAATAKESTVMREMQKVLAAGLGDVRTRYLCKELGGEEVPCRWDGRHARG